MSDLDPADSIPDAPAPVSGSLTTDPREARESPVLTNGQQSKYCVLSVEERAKGYVRPVRRAYRHTRCGTVTTMGLALCETYARQPTFYGATFCVHCRGHYLVGADGEFVWIEEDGTDGPKVGV